MKDASKIKVQIYKPSHLPLVTRQQAIGVINTMRRLIEEGATPGDKIRATKNILLMLGHLAKLEKQSNGQKV